MRGPTAPMGSCLSHQAPGGCARIAEAIWRRTHQERHREGTSLLHRGRTQPPEQHSSTGSDPTPVIQHQSNRFCGNSTSERSRDPGSAPLIDSLEERESINLSNLASLSTPNPIRAARGLPQDLWEDAMTAWRTHPPFLTRHRLWSSIRSWPQGRPAAPRVHDWALQRSR